MKTLSIAIVLCLMASPAFALDCKNFPIGTPDNAPVARVGGGSNANLSGTAYTKATFCPTAAAAGTCTGESLSEKVNSHAYITFDGIVADIERHRLGLNIDPPGPAPVVFIPLTGYILGACGA